MRALSVVTLLALTALTSCSTTPAFVENGYPTADGTVETGLAVYQDRDLQPWVPRGVAVAIDLNARITKDQSFWGQFFGDSRRRLVQTSLVLGSQKVTYRWVCEYLAGSQPQNENYHYAFRMEEAPPGIVVTGFETTAPALRGELPFEVFQAEVRGRSWRVVGVRDLVWYRSWEWSSERGSSESTWWSLHDAWQKFQVVDGDNTVLAELAGTDDHDVPGFRYTISAATPPAAMDSMKVFLGMVVSLNRFLAEAESYRSLWSPDVHLTAPGDREDWPSF